VADFSAVAYFFGLNVAREEKVTIGLIDASWGGTPADSWVSLDGLASNPVLLPAFVSRAHFAAHLASQDALLAAEKREDDEARAAGKPVPMHNWHPSERSWAPAELYNGMISPLTPYSIKGFIWYQGETNSGPDRAPYYATLFPALIADWRSHFQQGDLPFLYVQISSFNSPGEGWGMIRDAQRRALSVRNTAMAVSLDVGNPDNVHPADKQTVGMRLALAAEGLAYATPVEFASPLFREATTEAGGMRVWFDHGDGLSSHGKPVEGFELAGDDHRFFPANAVILGDSVLVNTPAIRQPRYVRYAWTNVAPPGLYNSAGLPASTFDSEPSPLD
jgi:sialate O-acetylesterase